MSKNKNKQINNRKTEISKTFILESPKGLKVFSKALSLSLMKNRILSRWSVSISSVSHDFCVGYSSYSRIRGYALLQSKCKEALFASVISLHKKDEQSALTSQSPEKLPIMKTLGTFGLVFLRI